MERRIYILASLFVFGTILTVRTTAYGLGRGSSSSNLDISGGVTVEKSVTLTGSHSGTSDLASSGTVSGIKSGFSDAVSGIKTSVSNAVSGVKSHVKSDLSRLHSLHSGGGTLLGNLGVSHSSGAGHGISGGYDLTSGQSDHNTGGSAVSSIKNYGVAGLSSMSDGGTDSILSGTNNPGHSALGGSRIEGCSTRNVGLEFACNDDPSNVANGVLSGAATHILSASGTGGTELSGVNTHGHSGSHGLESNGFQDLTGITTGTYSGGATNQGTTVVGSYTYSVSKGHGLSSSTDTVHSGLSDTKALSLSGTGSSFTNGHDSPSVHDGSETQGILGNGGQGSSGYTSTVTQVASATKVQDLSTIGDIVISNTGSNDKTSTIQSNSDSILTISKDVTKTSALTSAERDVFFGSSGSIVSSGPGQESTVSGTGGATSGLLNQGLSQGGGLGTSGAGNGGSEVLNHGLSSGGVSGLSGVGGATSGLSSGGGYGLSGVGGSTSGLSSGGGYGVSGAGVTSSGLSSGGGYGLPGAGGATSGLSSGGGHGFSSVGGATSGLSSGGGHYLSGAGDTFSGLSSGGGYGFSGVGGATSGLSSGGGYDTSGSGGTTSGLSSGGGHGFSGVGGATSGLSSGGGHGFSGFGGTTSSLSSGGGHGFSGVGVGSSGLSSGGGHGFSGVGSSSSGLSSGGGHGFSGVGGSSSGLSSGGGHGFSGVGGATSGLSSHGYSAGTGHNILGYVNRGINAAREAADRGVNYGLSFARSYGLPAGPGASGSSGALRDFTSQDYGHGSGGVSHGSDGSSHTNGAVSGGYGYGYGGHGQGHRGAHGQGGHGVGVGHGHGSGVKGGSFDGSAGLSFSKSYSFSTQGSSSGSTGQIAKR